MRNQAIYSRTVVRQLSYVRRSCDIDTTPFAIHDTWRTYYWRKYERRCPFLDHPIVNSYFPYQSSTRILLDKSTRTVECSICTALLQTDSPVSGRVAVIILSVDVHFEVQQRLDDGDVAGDDGRVQRRVSTLVRCVKRCLVM